MAPASTHESIPEPPFRLWPGVLVVVLQWLLRFALPAVIPEALPIGALAGLLGGIAVIVWWAFFSRAPRAERWGGSLLMIVGLVVARSLSHESISTGMMGLLIAVYATPILSLAFVIWAWASRSLPGGARPVTMVATILLACGVWTLVRTEGLTGSGGSVFDWRWSPTAEEQLLVRGGDRPLPPPADPAASKSAARAPLEVSGEPAADTVPLWPGFRGPERDGIVRGVRIRTDWSPSPPVELWRRAVGPGWSSFAVGGELFYTQEQRGEEEIVACYELTTGAAVWAHRDPVRFWESNAGAGPRATPALAGGRVYALGATGVLSALDAADGSILWSCNAQSDTGAAVPEWGISGSPLVVGDTVIVAASGVLIAYDAASGEPRWKGPAGRESYSSPHLLTIDRVAQVLLMTDAGLTSLAAADGSVLWEYSWPGDSIVQPAQVADGELLISTGATAGVRSITVTRGAGGWDVQAHWTSTRLKPYFNDFVVHGGHAFGIDRGLLACIDVEDGQRKWKGGRYGCGQLVLLEDQGVLLVLSEEGELVLVAADSEQFTELARFPAFEGKTWNHPVLAGDVLLVRNDQAMVAFQLSLVDG